MKILGCPHLWIVWLITYGAILLYLLTAYAVSIGFRTFYQSRNARRTESRGQNNAGTFCLVFVRNFIDILAEHHANSKMQIIRVSTDARGKKQVVTQTTL